VINTSLARRYAKALVQLGAEENLIERFRDELTVFQNAFSANAELNAVFSDPALTVEQKKRIMQSLIDKAQPSALVSNFLMLLVDKNRVAFLGQIVQAYQQLADEHSGVIRPTVKSAFPLDASQITSIQTALEKKSGKKVFVQSVVDKSLIGGIVTQIGDTAFDSSVKTQLKRIQDILQKG